MTHPGPPKRSALRCLEARGPAGKPDRSDEPRIWACARMRRLHPNPAIHPAPSSQGRAPEPRIHDQARGSVKRRITGGFRVRLRPLGMTATGAVGMIDVTENECDSNGLPSPNHGSVPSSPGRSRWMGISRLRTGPTPGRAGTCRLRPQHGVRHGLPESAEWENPGPSAAGGHTRAHKLLASLAYPGD